MTSGAITNDFRKIIDRSIEALQVLSKTRKKQKKPHGCTKYLWYLCTGSSVTQKRIRQWAP